MLLILISKLATRQEGTQIKLYLTGMKKKTQRTERLKTPVQPDPGKKKKIQKSMLKTTTCTQRNYFELTKKSYHQLSLSPASSPFLRTL